MPPRTDITEIPILVTFLCNNCVSDRMAVRFYPRRNWKNFALIDIFKCPICGSFCTYKSGKQVDYNFKLNSNNTVVNLNVTGFESKRSTLIKLVNREILINIDAIPSMSFNGKLNIHDNSGKYLITFIYGSKGLQHIEIDSDLLVKYGVIIDKDHLKKLKRLAEESDTTRSELITRFEEGRVEEGEVIEPRELQEELLEVEEETPIPTERSTIIRTSNRGLNVAGATVVEEGERRRFRFRPRRERAR